MSVVFTATPSLPSPWHLLNKHFLNYVADSDRSYPRSLRKHNGQLQDLNEGERPLENFLWVSFLWLRMFTEWSDFIVKLTLSCPSSLTTHFYATGNFQQHLRHTTWGLYFWPWNTPKCCQKSPQEQPSTYDFQELVVKRPSFVCFALKWDNSEVVLHCLLEFLNGIEFL